MSKTVIVSILLFFMPALPSTAQTAGFADSIRKAFNIPELNYAVVSSEKIIEMQALGHKTAYSDRKADVQDLFRIGSNTKAITGFIAALLIKEGKIKWDTPFFDLFPELKPESNAAYYNVTLLDLLTFRTRLQRYTYTNRKPAEHSFTGSEDTQRYQFARWALHEKPAAADSMSYSNSGYVLAGLMLEKASGKTYKELVNSLGEKLNIQFYFDQPNNVNILQPWGHNGELFPEPPGKNVKLDWLLAAGGITVSLPDYAKFIQLQLQGMAGKSNLLSAQEFSFLHFGKPVFSVGWFPDSDENSNPFTHNTGNPGTFLTNVYVFAKQDRAIIIFANAQTSEAEEGEEMLFKQLYKTYIH